MVEIACSNCGENPESLGINPKETAGLKCPSCADGILVLKLWCPECSNLKEFDDMNSMDEAVHRCENCKKNIQSEMWLSVEPEN